MSQLQYCVDRKPSIRTDLCIFYVVLLRRRYTKQHKTTLDHLDNTVTSSKGTIIALAS